MGVFLENHVDSHADVLSNGHPRAVVQLFESRDLGFGQINRRGNLLTCHTPRVTGANTLQQAAQVVFPGFRLKYKKMLTTRFQKRFLLLVAVAGLGACSSSPSKPTQIQDPLPDREAGVELLSPDARTKTARQRRVFQESGARRILSRVESDFNGDGRVDFVQIYDPTGTWVQTERSDLDGDGRFDVSYIFTRSSGTSRETRLSEQHFDTNYDGQVDLWKEFDERGRVRLRSLDRDFDGRADYWEYYENAQVVRIERDNDGDGKPDSLPPPRTNRR